ncbi:MAG: phosphotyrosine protein phosphatase [Nanoarchaeota archaeon]
MNYLFVCTYNINRSVAAADIFRNLLKKHKLKCNVKSAGISETAKTRVTKELINWADKIYVMEGLHKDYLIRINPNAANKIEVLGIEDLYPVNDPELTRLLKEKLENELRNTGN